MEFIPEKKLGFGLMRLPQNDPANPADVDIEQLKKMGDGRPVHERGLHVF